MLNIFVKECRVWLKSWVFYGYLLFCFGTYLYVMRGDVTVEEPQEGQAYYESAWVVKDDQTIMVDTLHKLIRSYFSEFYLTYPYGKYLGNAQMTQEQLNQIEGYITEMIGDNKWNEREQEYLSYINKMRVQMKKLDFYEISDSLTYKRFLQILESIDVIIGPRSEFSPRYLEKSEWVEQTYESAKIEYQNFVNKEGITRAYAKVFCGRMVSFGGASGLFFVVVSFYRRRKSAIKECIYQLPLSTTSIVVGQILAMVTMVFLPIIMVSCLHLIEGILIAKKVGVTPDYSAHIVYSFLWILPTIIVVIGFSFWINECFGWIYGNVLSFVVWIFLVSMMELRIESVYVVGSIVPKYDLLRGTSYWNVIREEFFWNRLIYSGLGLIFIVFAIVVVHKKRGNC